MTFMAVTYSSMGRSVSYFYHTATPGIVYLGDHQPPRLRDECIRAEEPPQAGRIESCAVIIHPQRDLLPLAGEAPVGGEGAGREVGPRFTVGEVAPLADQGPGHGGGQGGAAQGVTVCRSVVLQPAAYQGC